MLYKLTLRWLLRVCLLLALLAGILYFGRFIYLEVWK